MGGRYALKCSTTKMIQVWWEDRQTEVKTDILLGHSKINNKDMRKVL